MKSLGFPLEQKDNKAFHAVITIHSSLCVYCTEVLKEYFVSVNGKEATWLQEI